MIPINTWEPVFTDSLVRIGSEKWLQPAAAEAVLLVVQLRQYPPNTDTF